MFINRLRNNVHYRDHDQLLRHIKQNSKHNNNGFNKCLVILAFEDLPPKLRKSKNSEPKSCTNGEEEGDIKKPQSSGNIA